MVSLKAHFDGRAIIPDEPLNLPLDQKLLVHVELADQELGVKSESALDWAIANAVDDPAVPADLSHQHDHYLYNTPKEAE